MRSPTVAAGALMILFAAHASAQSPCDPGAMSDMRQSQRLDQMAASDLGQMQGKVFKPTTPAPQDLGQPRRDHTVKSGHAPTTKMKSPQGKAPGTVEPT